MCNQWVIRFKMINSDLRLSSLSVVCGEVSAAPLAVCWGHVHVSGRGSASALGWQHQRAARRHQYDSLPLRADWYVCDRSQALPVTLSCFLQAADPNTCWSTSTPTVGSNRANASTSKRWRRCSPRQEYPRTWLVCSGHSTSFCRASTMTHLKHPVSSLCVTVTEYANYARDHLRKEAELKKFDGWGSFLSGVAFHNKSITEGLFV